MENQVVVIGKMMTYFIISNTQNWIGKNKAFVHSIKKNLLDQIDNNHNNN
jgi:hypothetical protein